MYKTNYSFSTIQYRLQTVSSNVSLHMSTTYTYVCTRTCKTVSVWRTCSSVKVVTVHYIPDICKLPEKV